ncbi:MAG TPA: S9 family peptidase, partial [Vicinamibacteria bacterium]|nr:S9 family peptidase [Vicinamibacteria bacterium]
MLALLLLVLASTSATAPRPLRVDDVYALRETADVQVSPDGRSAAFTVATKQMKEDETDTDVYLAPLAGGEAVRLTTSAKPERSPRFSPDGRWIAFLSGREGGKKTQVWLIPTTGGEATKLTEYRSGVSGLAWSPDSGRLALVVSDPDPDAVDEDEEGAAKKAKPKPVVIRRLQFKRDEDGYLRELRDHIHVFDLASRTGTQVTWGPYDDAAPAWSPDGRHIAFVSNRTADPDRNQDTDVFVVEARAGAEPRRLPTGPGRDLAPAWSPDGRDIAYVAGGDPKDMWYGPSHVAVIAAAGGEPRALTRTLDRNVSEPRFTPDGRHVLFLLEDGGRQHLARVPAGGGAATRLVEGDRDVKDFDLGRSGAVAVLLTEPHLPAEVFAVGAAGQLTRVSRVNDEVMKGLRLGRVEKRRARSAGGPAFDYFLTLPPDTPPGRKLPTLLWIHGGPASQDSFSFDLEWQMFAAHGYAVVAPNYRGSTGYGRDFSRALWAAWGTPDFQDAMAAVDDVVAAGIADPERLGVGGWSYGGILTDHVIVRTDRFKAAVSGASEVNYLANYGTDHYQYEWETELGLPWEHPERWIQLSPFFQVARVKTPTLILCGADDWNVPLLNSEQLYQALRRLGVPTELVVYPAQHHSIRRPSFMKDRLERYLGWFDRYLRPESARSAWDAMPQGLSLLGRPLVPAEPS